MRLAAKFAVLGLLAVPAAAMSGDSVKLTAGRWQETMTITRATIGDKELPLDLFKEENETKFACLTAKEAADPARYFMETEKKDDCDTPAGTVANGTMAFSATCRMDKKLPMKLSVAGTYGRDSYQSAIKAEAEMDGLPFVMDGTMDGKFVGACKGDETD